MNKIILTGRTCKDAELGFIGATGTPKMTFTLAVERNYQKDKNNKKVDFINCEMLGQHTEKLCQYVTKGKSILVEGELNIDQYEKDGEKRSFTKVKVIFGVPVAPINPNSASLVVLPVNTTLFIFYSPFHL